MARRWITTDSTDLRLPDDVVEATQPFIDAAIYVVADGTTDNTTGINTLLADWHAGGSGEIRWPEGTIRCDGQIVIPNDGAATYPRQKAMVWRGAGCYNDPVGGSGPYSNLVDIGGTILDLRYTGGGSNLAKIDTRGKGTFEVTGITFTDQGTSSNPFIKTTHTTLLIHDTSWVGNPSKAGVTCDQDAIVLGGTTTNLDDSDNAAFQGYGTVIRENNFHRIRRAVLFQNFANGVIVRDNNIWVSCGSNLANGAAIEFAPTAGTGIFGNVVDSNLIETLGYVYPIKLAGTGGMDVSGCSITHNNFYDPAGGTLGYIRLDNVDAKHNLIICGYGGGAVPHVSEAIAGINMIINPQSSATSSIAGDLLAYQGLTTAVLATLGVGNPELQLAATSSSPPSVYVSTAAPSFAAQPGSIDIVKATAALGEKLWVKEHSTDGTGWFSVGRFAPRTLATKTGNYTVAFYDDILIFDTASGTCTLLSAVGITGRIFRIKNINATALPVATTSSQTVDGAAPATIPQWTARSFLSDGANWLTL